MYSNYQYQTLTLLLLISIMLASLTCRLYKCVVCVLMSNIDNGYRANLADWVEVLLSLAFHLEKLNPPMKLDLAHGRKIGSRILNLWRLTAKERLVPPSQSVQLRSIWPIMPVYAPMLEGT